MSAYYGDKSSQIPSWDALDADDDQDIVDNSEYAYAARDHVLFCIDASRSMQTPRPDTSNEGGLVRGKSALQQVLEAVADLERKKVITGPADSVGVMLWNVDSSKIKSVSNGNYKPGTMVYQPLRTINAEEMKKVIKLVEAAQDQYQAQEEDEDKVTTQPQAISEAFPAADETSELNIADVLVTCNFLFRDAGTKLAGNKRVFMISDNDEPNGSSSTRDPARTVYGDLLTYGITINTFFIDTPERRFNPTLYWNDILGREADQDAPNEDDAEPEGLDKLADLLTDLAIRNAPKRVQFSIPLRFGGKDGDIEIGVAGYSLVSEQGKGVQKYVRMRGQVVEEVAVKTEYTSAETGATLREDEIGRAFQFGHESTIRNVLEPNWWETSDVARRQELADEVVRQEQDRRRRIESGEEEEQDVKEVKPRSEPERITARTRLQFTAEEIAQFKSMGLSPQIKVIGFQSPDNLAIEDNIKHSYFIYPDEDAYTGSTRTFASLLKSCLKKRRHALAICRFRSNSMPEMAVLVPQEEVISEGGGQDMPPGFHVIVLPFVDDIRAPPKAMTENLLANEDQTKLMANIVKRLRSKAGKYRSEVYPNPALQYHYAQLQALAFEEDFDLAQRIDDIDKTYPKYHGMHRAAGELMKKWNEVIDEDSRATMPVTKGGYKRPIQDIDETDLADVKGMWEQDKMKTLKVAELREYIKYHQIPSAGLSRKDDLITVVADWLEKGGGTGKKSKT